MNPIFWLLGGAALFAMLGGSSGSVSPRAPDAASSSLPWWTDADFTALGEVAKELRMSPADLLLVLYSESGLKPDAVYRTASGAPVAVGLNQITGTAAKAMGLTNDEWLSIPAKPVSEQLRKYVARFFAMLAWTASGKSYVNAPQVYFANFAPGRMRDPIRSTDVAFSVADGAAYTENKGLDTNNDGTIDAGDLSRWLRIRSQELSKDPSSYQAALARMNSVLRTSLTPTFL